MYTGAGINSVRTLFMFTEILTKHLHWRFNLIFKRQRYLHLGSNLMYEYCFHLFLPRASYINIHYIKHPAFRMMLYANRACVMGKVQNHSSFLFRMIYWITEIHHDAVWLNEIEAHSVMWHIQLSSKISVRQFVSHMKSENFIYVFTLHKEVHTRFR